MAMEKLLKDLQSRRGQDISVGSWLEIDQKRINDFAEVTGDRQWIHVDSERARRESPYGATVAHGFLTLSLLPYLTRSNQPDEFQKNYSGMAYRVNYGLNKVRFPAPVIVGHRIRARMQLKDIEIIQKALQIVYRITVEIEGLDKPACVAEQVVRLFPKEEHESKQ